MSYAHRRKHPEAEHELGQTPGGWGDERVPIGISEGLISVDATPFRDGASGGGASTPRSQKREQCGNAEGARPTEKM